MNTGASWRSAIRSTLSGLLALAVAVPSGAQGPGPPPPAPSGGRTVARVGQMRIGYDELDQQERQALQLYRDRNRTEVAPELVPLIRRQVLENLIRQRLLALDARRRGLTVSDAEAEAQLKLDPAFQQGGIFNEAKYLAIRAANPDAYARALAATRDALAARKAGERMDRETRPDDAAIRAEVEAELTRATFEVLPLRGRDFDGGYPEPREEEVLAFHRANAARFLRPEEASVSLLVFHRPAPTDSMAATDAGYRAWEQRMRARADSALAAIRSGASADDIALRNGGWKTVTLRRDDPPDPWRGGARELAAAFAAAPGTLLPEPVRAAPGWALVRVERVLPARTAPLREVAREIRAELRAAARAAVETRLFAEAYAAMRDSLRGDGFRVRYAVADTSSFAPGEPGAAEIDRYYRAHLADYTSYDRAAGRVVEVPLAQVREDVRRRWMRERRKEMARLAAERLSEAWSRGRRDPALERAMTRVRDLGVVPAFGEPDTGRAGPPLAATLAGRGGRPGVTMVPMDGGFLVFELRERVADYLATPEQSRVRLAPLVEARRAAELEAQARRAFEADSTAYRSRPVIHFSRLLISPPPVLEVELTREEVERFYRANLKNYSVEELARVRHILIATSGRGALPVQEARARAEELLARLRAGEDFARLAAEHSHDDATRLNGGDVGVFRRGMMREAFERAAFAMRPGDLAGPVRTEVGYHILESLEYHPPVFHPLAEVYANVAFDCASRKAQHIAVERADSLYGSLRSVAQAKAAAERLGLDILAADHEEGRYGRFDADLIPYIQKVERLRPGELYPGTQMYVGLGPVITWVDRVTPPRQLRWEEVRESVIESHRRERGWRALLAKREELDSLSAAGRGIDSLAAAWGGLERVSEAAMGSDLRGMGGRALLDSLVFGRPGRPPLPVGQLSGWVEFPGGLVRLRVTERFAPDPDELARRSEQRRQVVLWRNLKAYFDRLGERYPVEILDGELRATALLEPSES